MPGKNEDQGERSFDPTPLRRESFQKQGRFARSRDAGSVAATFAVVAVLIGSEARIESAVEQAFVQCHGNLDALGRGEAEGAFQAALALLSVLAAPAVVGAALTGTGVGLVQGGARVYTEVIGFHFERLNPFPNLARLFSPKEGTTQAILSVLRVGFVGYVAYRAAVLQLPVLLAASHQGVRAGGALIVESAGHVMLTALGALAAVAALDYVQSRFSLERQMKMTRREMTEENRSQSGDPKVKAKMKARLRAMARRRALENVKRATVIVVNPTHVSVALRYKPADAAPIVLAKGHDEIALAIRSEARKHGIPILENRPLARALDAEVEVGRSIPAAHFAAVAKILAYIYKTHGSKHGMGRA
jgi:flagellar biosynthetic protein FlhB